MYVSHNQTNTVDHVSQINLQVTLVCHLILFVLLASSKQHDEAFYGLKLFI